MGVNWWCRLLANRSDCKRSFENCLKRRFPGPHLEIFWSSWLCLGSSSLTCYPGSSDVGILGKLCLAAGGGWREGSEGGQAGWVVGRVPTGASSRQSGVHSSTREQTWKSWKPLPETPFPEEAQSETVSPAAAEQLSQLVILWALREGVMWFVQAQLGGVLSWVPPEPQRLGFACQRSTWEVMPGSQQGSGKRWEGKAADAREAIGVSEQVAALDHWRWSCRGHLGDCCMYRWMVPLGRERLRYFALKSLLSMIEGCPLELLAYSGFVGRTLCSWRSPRQSYRPWQRNAI